MNEEKPNSDVSTYSPEYRTIGVVGCFLALFGSLPGMDFSMVGIL